MVVSPFDAGPEGTNRWRSQSSAKVTASTVCGLTGFSRPDDLKGWGYIFMHNEDYNRPLRFHPLSRAAHYALHSRFTDPLPWLKLVRKHYVHGAWFTFLTLNPGDMRRPYDAVKLRKLVADLSLDREMLQDVIRRAEGQRSKNCEA